MKLDSIKNEITGQIAIQTEEYIKLHLKPKPKYLPKFLWYKILNKLLVLKKFK